MSGEEKISINIGQDKKIELEVEVEVNGANKVLFVKLTPEIVKTIVEAGINSEVFITEVQKALDLKKALPGGYIYKKNAIFSYRNESKSQLTAKSFEFLAQLFEKNVHRYINDARRFLDEIKEYKEKGFLLALVEWQLNSLQDKHEGQEFKKFLETKDELDQKTVLDEATRKQIEEAVDKVTQKVQQSDVKITNAITILNNETSSKIQKLDAQVELFELIEDETVESIIIKEKLSKLIPSQKITEKKQLTDILSEEQQDLLWKTINQENKEVKEDKIIATKLLIKLYQNKGYLTEDNQITEEGLNNTTTEHLAALYRASIELGDEDQVSKLSLNLVNGTTFEKAIELLKKLNPVKDGSRTEIKIQDEDLLKALQSYIETECKSYKPLFAPKYNTIKILATLREENEQLYNKLMDGIKLKNMFQNSFKKNIEKKATKKQGKVVDAYEDQQSTGADVYGNKQPINLEDFRKDLQIKLNEKFVDTCEDEDVKKERRGIIARIIAFLSGIINGSERESLATCIQDFEDFDQLKDFDKSLNGIVNQTRKNVDSIFLKSYNHRRDRLEHYTNILEAEKVCIALSKKIDGTQDKKVKKTLKGDLEEALKHYRDISGKHRYSLLITEHQLKKIESNIEKTKEHMEKHKKALEVLEDTTDEVTTEVAGRRTQNNQLLRKVGLIR